MKRYGSASIVKSDFDGQESWIIFYSDTNHIPDWDNHVTRVAAGSKDSIVSLDQAIQHLRKFLKPTMSDLFVISLDPLKKWTVRIKPSGMDFESVTIDQIKAKISAVYKQKGE